MITHYDYVDIGLAGCHAMLVRFVHETVARFSEAGSASIVIMGRDARPREEPLIEIIREVVVLQGPV